MDWTKLPTHIPIAALMCLAKKKLALPVIFCQKMANIVQISTSNYLLGICRMKVRK